MIILDKKEDCCGCMACVQICPIQCINLTTDNEGFVYPVVNTTACLNCGLCNKVCPMLKSSSSHSPLLSIAYKNPIEEERYNSSSGGFFIMLAKRVVAEGGVVFGVTYDTDWMPVHSYAETYEGIKAFMGSKYVQSNVGSTYIKAKEYLLKGRLVLYTGTPCQIAGLKSFLRKEYDNLITIEIMCHGVPSPGVWKNYINEVCQYNTDNHDTATSPSLCAKSSIEGISFRDKSNGWTKYDFVIYGKASSAIGHNAAISSKNYIVRQWSKQNPYMQAFLCNVILRPSCYSCKHKTGKSGADFSIGDFWTVDTYKPLMNDDKGVSLVYVLSEKGKCIFANLQCSYEKLSVDVEYNSAFVRSSCEKYPRKKFWKLYEEQGLSCITGVYNSLKPDFFRKMYIRIINRLMSLKHML